MISEIYESFQGTGDLGGTKQLFIRFSGCSVKCPIRSVCDEQESLAPNGKIAIEDAVAAIEGYHGKWIHITGGEPLEHERDILRLVAAANNHEIQIQTSGFLDMKGLERSFVTCSPKCWPVGCKLSRCDELVFVAHKQMTPEFIDQYSARFPMASRYVIPLWGDSAESAIRLISKAKKECKLGIQAHKHWGID